MKLLLIFALVAVASADISSLLNKYLPPARSNQGSSNSLSILPAILQLKQSFSGAQQGAQQGSYQQGAAQQPQIIKVIHVSQAAPQQQHQQYYSAPQPSFNSGPSNQYLPPVVQHESVYQSHPVDQVTVHAAAAPFYHHKSAQQVQYVHQQAPQVHYQPATVQHEPVDVQIHVQHVAAPQIQEPLVQYVQQPTPQVQYVQQPAPQVQYAQPQAYDVPSQTFQAPAATFNDVSGYSYNAPH